ncbi:MAG: hypothetical protein GY815_09455 [Gammaproteobacteria bacterium]|nr:hypothetical protein [Gammaproteobacteria bacterium]
MSSTPTRSEEVVESFKQHKLALSAMRRIHELIQSFEQERATDKRLAGVGLLLILLLLGVSLYFFMSGDSVTLR